VTTPSDQETWGIIRYAAPEPPGRRPPHRLRLCDRAARNKRTEQGRNVGAAPTSNNYAPTVFAKEDCGFNRKQLDAALRRLFAAGRIKVESYGKPSRPNQRLARVGAAYGAAYGCRIGAAGAASCHGRGGCSPHSL
jgi:hypothetical protein